MEDLPLSLLPAHFVLIPTKVGFPATWDRTFLAISVLVFSAMIRMHNFSVVAPNERHYGDSQEL